jgi:hypothetical protein
LAAKSTPEVCREPMFFVWSTTWPRGPFGDSQIELVPGSRWMRAQAESMPPSTHCFMIVSAPTGAM